MGVNVRMIYSNKTTIKMHSYELKTVYSGFQQKMF